ncbi:MAG: DegV family protein [Clostridiales bacterium]
MAEKEIRIVTDSTADLPPEFIKQNRITVVPLHITFPKGGAYRDGLDLTAKDFYPLLLAAGDAIPKTSTPTKDEFARTYQELIAESPDCQIISIHLSGGLSSTISVAQTAAREVSPDIFPFDSRNISFGMGLQVLEAIRLIKEGAAVKKILDHLSLVAAHTETMFCLDTLEYLYKGGRIGRVTAFFGSILNVKPIIHVKDGVYESFDKVRSQKQAIQKMVDRGLSVLDGRKPLRMGVIHGACESMADLLKEKVETAYGKAVDCFSETGAVIGTHTGPGTLGMTVCHL